MVRTGVWHLVASKMDIKTVEIRDKDPSPVDDKSEWENWQGHAIVVLDDDGLKLFKCQDSYPAQYKLQWLPLKPSYELRNVTKAMLDRAMALRLIQDGVDAGPLLPAGLIRKEPIDQFARVTHEVMKASNK